MSQHKSTPHPYMPNSVPEIRDYMLKEIGVANVDELYSEIPEALRFKGKLNMPEPFSSEFELKKHVESILTKNWDCNENLSFLGAGCYQHYIPAVVDEVIGRGEFLTAYQGHTYTDQGRYQVCFEYVSMLTELLGMGAAGMPTFDSFAGSGTGIRITGRITDRDEILVAKNISSDRLVYIQVYCKDIMDITMVEFDVETGLINLEDLKSKLSSDTAGLYVENPGYLGPIEYRWEEIATLVHDNGSLLVVGVNPMSLGLLEAPGSYGADIVTGDTQPLGVHMNCGGGATGFVAVKDDEALINELPTLMWTITGLENGEEGFGFIYCRPGRLSYASREDAVEFTGTATALWSIANAVYLSLMGPQGMREIGVTIVERAHYAKQKIAEIEGIVLPIQVPHFNEFMINFDRTGKSVAEINRKLLSDNIFGGKDMSLEFPEYGQSALFCISEIHTKEEIDQLCSCLKEAIQ